MNPVMVGRYYELMQKLRELEEEKKMLNEEIKREMLKGNITEATIGKYSVRLQRNDRSEVKDTVIPYLKATGHQDLIIETYDREMFKELEKRGVFDETELKKHRVEKFVYALYVKPY